MWMRSAWERERVMSYLRIVLSTSIPSPGSHETPFQKPVFQKDMNVLDFYPWSPAYREKSWTFWNTQRVSYACVWRTVRNIGECNDMVLCVLLNYTEILWRIHCIIDCTFDRHKVTTSFMILRGHRKGKDLWAAALCMCPLFESLNSPSQG